MSELGYLAFDGRGKTYFPTPKVSDLGSWLSPELLKGGLVDVVMERINAHTRETVYLAVQRHLSVHYLRVYPGLHPISLTISESANAPLFGSAIGKALLSVKPEDELSKLVGRDNDSRKGGELGLESLKESLSEARKNGYGAVFDSVVPGAGSIAVALTGLQHYGSYAIGVGGPTDRMRDNLVSIADTMKQELSDSGLI